MKNNNLFGELATNYYLLAGTELAMNYYSLYETWVKSSNDEENDTVNGVRMDMSELSESNLLRDELGRLIAAAGECEKQDCDRRKELLNDALKLREEIRRRMLSVMAFSDHFRLYEYVLNRMEPAFYESLEDINNDEAAREILQRIFSVNDNPVINDNIKLAVSQLPIRMTKSRFFDIIGESLKKYIGSDRELAKKLIYMIESAAGIISVDDDKIWKELYETEEYFAGLNFAISDKAKYDEAVLVLTAGAERVNNTIELLNSLQELTNLLCVVLINYDNADSSRCEEVRCCDNIIFEAAKGFDDGVRNEMSETALKTFRKIEGRLENYVEKLNRLEAGLENYVNGGGERNEQVKQLEMSAKLMSSSVFVDLEEAEEVILGEEEAEKLTAEVAAHFGECFAEGTKLMNRARMAAALKELPVFFASRTEVMNYVRDSLDGCRDIGEKLVSVRLILDSI